MKRNYYLRFLLAFCLSFTCLSAGWSNHDICTNVSGEWWDNGLYFFIKRLEDPPAFGAMLCKPCWTTDSHDTVFKPYKQTDLVVPATSYFDGEDLSVLSIGHSCFVGSECKTITLPNTIREIQQKAFYCSTLETLRLYIQDPDVIPTTVEVGSYEDMDGNIVHQYGELDAFYEEQYENLKVLVPPGTLEKYKNHAVFGKFKHIEEDDTLLPVQEVRQDSEDKAEHYTLGGMKTNADANGIVITRQKDGSSRKYVNK